MKVYLLNVHSFNSNGKTYYKANIYSQYGFMTDMFVDKDLYDVLLDLYNSTGISDITDMVFLRYNQNKNKLEYYFK